MVINLTKVELEYIKMLLDLKKFKGSKVHKSTRKQIVNALSSYPGKLRGPEIPARFLPAIFDDADNAG